ncbi:ribose-5-phosphate isomerase rki1 [Cryomyces antarcticus]|nr:ribose-5-phosphate isomerase rki1 [Cryomyces antarcticus]
METLPANSRPTTSRAMTTNLVEEAKRLAGIRAVSEHFDPSARYVGIGSGTTIIYVVEAIKEVIKQRNITNNIQFVPTGYQSRQVIVDAGLTPIAFDSLPDGVMLEVAFDGADEVDEELNCIKGGGACLFQEKLVATRAKKFVCVADYRKNQSRLLTSWPSVPIEVAPMAARTVITALRALGSPATKVRSGILAKAGPLKTDQDFFIVDAPFKPLLTASDVRNGQDGSGKDGVWDIETLCQKIKMISGVLEVGLFVGKNGYETQAEGGQGGQKPVAAYFGMADGSVEVRRARPGTSLDIV